MRLAACLHQGLTHPPSAYASKYMISHMVSTLMMMSASTSGRPAGQSAAKMAADITATGASWSTPDRVGSALGSLLLNINFLQHLLLKGMCTTVSRELSRVPLHVLSQHCPPEVHDVMRFLLQEAQLATVKADVLWMVILDTVPLSAKALREAASGCGHMGDHPWRPSMVLPKGPPPESWPLYEIVMKSAGTWVVMLVWLMMHHCMHVSIHGSLALESEHRVSNHSTCDVHYACQYCIGGYDVNTVTPAVWILLST